MTGVFQRILEKGAKSGIAPAKTKEARDWFRLRASKENAATRRQLVTESSRQKNKISIGKMYYFVYDAKHKEDLPFWDAFPMIFPFRDDGKYFYGINLHLAPPKLRAVIMDALYGITNNEKFNDSTKLILSYKALMALSSHNLIKPIVRKYLKTHVRSKFIEVKANEWDIALFLPYQEFRNASSQKVYSEYRKRIV